MRAKAGKCTSRDNSDMWCVGFASISNDSCHCFAGLRLKGDAMRDEVAANSDYGLRWDNEMKVNERRWCSLVEFRKWIWGCHFTSAFYIPSAPSLAGTSNEFIYVFLHLNYTFMIHQNDRAKQWVDATRLFVSSVCILTPLISRI